MRSRSLACSPLWTRVHPDTLTFRAPSDDGARRDQRPGSQRRPGLLFFRVMQSLPAPFVYRRKTPHSLCGKTGSTPVRGTRSTCGRGREVRPLSATQENAGSNPADRSHCSRSINHRHGVVAQRESARFASERSRVQSPAAPLSSRSHSSHIRRGSPTGRGAAFRVQRLRVRIPLAAWQSEVRSPQCVSCSGMRLDRSTAVYRVNRVRFPVGALFCWRHQDWAKVLMMRHASHATPYSMPVSEKRDSSSLT